jgi:RNA-directed DNA polymerase
VIDVDLLSDIRRWLSPSIRRARVSARWIRSPRRWRPGCSARRAGAVNAGAGPARAGEAGTVKILYLGAARKVRKLQLRIARASRQKRWRLVRQLQRCLTRSHYAKLLAVKKVTGNRGRRTPGVDGEIWSTPEAKLKAALRLRSTRYRASPLRRVYIPKSNGKLRPLSIPTMYDRAMQALHAQALLPISETLAAKYSYGFRPGRSTADAIERCLKVLAGKDAATWVLEADIEGCFDNISHCWIEKHIPMQHSVLRQWLKSGVVESKRLFPTAKGVPQGGIISPIISNMVLDALEQRLEELLPKTSLRYRRAKVHIVRYADDFVVTGSSPKYLEETVTPLMVACLKQRGLKLSAAKTRITHIADGFDFLGQTVRKRQGKLLITPSRASQKAFKRKVRATLHKLRAASQWRVINTLRPLIRGWGNYHHHVVSSVVFSKMDAWLWRALWRWAVRRHPNKRKSWVKNRYFARLGTRDWMFVDKRRAGLSGSQEYKPDMDALRLSTLPYLSSIRIRRHIQIRSDANPFDPEWDEYFGTRRIRKRFPADWPFLDSPLVVAGLSSTRGGLTMA